MLAWSAISKPARTSPVQARWHAADHVTHVQFGQFVVGEQGLGGCPALAFGGAYETGFAIGSAARYYLNKGFIAGFDCFNDGKYKNRDCFKMIGFFYRVISGFISFIGGATMLATCREIFIEGASVFLVCYVFFSSLFSLFFYLLAVRGKLPRLLKWME